jgi:hypothetical protein
MAQFAPVSKAEQHFGLSIVRWTLEVQAGRTGYKVKLRARTAFEGSDPAKLAWQFR